jgi:hypothetical protein
MMAPALVSRAISPLPVRPVTLPLWVYSFRFASLCPLFLIAMIGFVVECVHVVIQDL